MEARTRRLTRVGRAKTSDTPFLLFKLPLELRNKIYSKILKYSHDSYLNLCIKAPSPDSHADSDFEEVFQYRIPDSASALLSAHPQLHREFLANASHCNRVGHNIKTCTQTRYPKDQLYKKVRKLVLEFTVPLPVYGKDSESTKDMLMWADWHRTHCLDLLAMEEENLQELECKATFLDEFGNLTEEIFSRNPESKGWMHKSERMGNILFNINLLKRDILWHFEEQRVGEMIFDLEL